MASCAVTTCNCTTSFFHWSSTTNQGFAAFAWVVDAGAGDVFADFKSSTYHVRAVRDGS